ncbi:MAG: hypothetical protein Q7T82_16145 [Armatimonadota bacterium]|nr:hypothetical protein [Armatimonadota bacterium]
MDDHKYSVGRMVVFRLPEEARRPGATGRWAGKASGAVVAAQLAQEPERWVYTVERQRTRDRLQVNEEDILYGVPGRRKSSRESQAKEERGERLAGMLDHMASDSALADFLRTTVRDLVRREIQEETARREGRELPLGVGDYIRVRGDLRQELERYHNYYGKIIEVVAPDIGGLEIRQRDGEPRTHSVTSKYLVFLDDGSLVEVYDPEVKLYYTANSRSTILNWRAATFLAEAFGDDPPYKVEYSYLEDHIFAREDLTTLSLDQLVELLASILYVKGHMGWRDFQEQQGHLAGLSRAYLVDSILAASRFDQRKNRAMTPREIEEKRHRARKFKELLGR